jgi:siroheme synthase-like protein
MSSTPHDTSFPPQGLRYRAMPVAWVSSCRHVLIAGGSYETESRLRHAMMFDWVGIRVVVARLTPFLREARRRDLRIVLHEREVLEGDIAQADFVIEDTGDPALAQRIAAWCELHHKPLNACDKPELCDLYYMSLVTLGPLVLGISSGGDAPAVASTLRRWLGQNLSPGWAMAAELMADLRRSLPSGHARMDLLKRIARHESFVRLIEQNDRAGLKDLISDELRRI